MRAPLQWLHTRMELAITWLRICVLLTFRACDRGEHTPNYRTVIYIWNDWNTRFTHAYAAAIQCHANTNWTDSFRFVFGRFAFRCDRFAFFLLRLKRLSMCIILKKSVLWFICSRLSIRLPIADDDDISSSLLIRCFLFAEKKRRRKIKQSNHFAAIASSYSWFRWT